MKIITAAALAAATLVLTAAVPALADGDPGTDRTDQKSSPTSVTSENNNPTASDEEEEEPEIDLSEGLLPRLVGKVL